MDRSELEASIRHVRHVLGVMQFADMEPGTLAWLLIEDMKSNERYRADLERAAQATPTAEPPDRDVQRRSEPREM